MPWGTDWWGVMTNRKASINESTCYNRFCIDCMSHPLCRITISHWSTLRIDDNRRMKWKTAKLTIKMMVKVEQPRYAHDNRDEQRCRTHHQFASEESSVFQGPPSRVVGLVQLHEHLLFRQQSQLASEKQRRKPKCRHRRTRVTAGETLQTFVNLVLFTVANGKLFPIHETPEVEIGSRSEEWRKIKRSVQITEELFGDSINRGVNTNTVIQYRCRSKMIWD